MQTIKFTTTPMLPKLNHTWYGQTISVCKNLRDGKTSPGFQAYGILQSEESRNSDWYYWVYGILQSEESINSIDIIVCLNFELRNQNKCFYEIDKNIN